MGSNPISVIFLGLFILICVTTKRYNISRSREDKEMIKTICLIIGGLVLTISFISLIGISIFKNSVNNILS